MTRRNASRRSLVPRCSALPSAIVAVLSTGMGEGKAVQLRYLLRGCVALVGAVLLFLAPAFTQPLGAADFTVTVTLADDSTNAACASSGIAPCSLRDAVTFANNAGSTTIAFSLPNPSTITLTTNTTLTLRPLGSGMTITGPGAAALTIDGNCTLTAGVCTSGGTTVFTVESTTRAASISGLTIQHGNETVGTGGIDNFGTLTVTNSTISGNNGGCGSGCGGGINNVGRLTVTGSTISGNTSSGGGGINTSGMATVTNSTISGNKASGFGGGILNYSGGTLTVTGSTISGNNASGTGGGILNLDTATVTNSTLTGNTSKGPGGGIDNSGTLTVTGSTMPGNTSNSGGGIDNSGTLTVTNSTLSGNNATSGTGGGIANNTGGTATVTNSTLSGNKASVTSGGGIANNTGGTATVTNSTLSGNTATSFGGGIANNTGGTLMVTNCTLSGNTATSFGGGINNGGTLTVTNTIVAVNTANSNGPDVFGALVSGGHNLVGSTFGSGGWVASDLTGTFGSLLNPRLGAVGNNGGPTQTFPLLPGSPAIGHGDPAVCAATGVGKVNGVDQRGFLRQAGVCSIGAFEAQPAPPNPLPPSKPPGLASGPPSPLPGVRPAGMTGSAGGPAPNPLPVNRP